MASQHPEAYIVPQVRRQKVFCCQGTALATQTPNVSLGLNSINPDRQTYEDVERLAVQHVLEVPNPAKDGSDALLRQASHLIPAQEVQHPELQTVWRPLVGQPRFFAIHKAPGQLGIETWIEIEITEDRLESDERFAKDHPSTVFTGTLTYDCDDCKRRYLVSFWRKIMVLSTE